MARHGPQVNAAKLDPAVCMLRAIGPVVNLMWNHVVQEIGPVKRELARFPIAVYGVEALTMAC